MNNNKIFGWLLFCIWVLSSIACGLEAVEVDSVIFDSQLLFVSGLFILAIFSGVLFVIEINKGYDDHIDGVIEDTIFKQRYSEIREMMDGE